MRGEAPLALDAPRRRAVDDKAAAALSAAALSAAALSATALSAAALSVRCGLVGGAVEPASKDGDARTAKGGPSDGRHAAERRVVVEEA